MRKIMIIVYCLTVFTSFFNISCTSKEVNLSVQKALIKASDALGIEIPLPHYLPEGYKLKNVVVSENTTVILGIFNKENKEIELEITWKPTGIIPYKIDLNAPTVEFNGFIAQLIGRDETKIGIVWNWYPDRYKPGLIVLTLLAPQDFSVTELKMIAQSIGWNNVVN